MELSEASNLAATVILSVIFKVHSLPIHDRAANALPWWQAHGSRIPLRPALEENRRHLSQFASRRRPDNMRGRQVFLTISAVVDDDGRGHCPALVGNYCGIYDARPLTCRTVPMHYSRPPSALRDYLDRFTGTPGYRCDITQMAPVVLDGNAVIDPTVRQYRDEAINLAKAERGWKDQMLLVMDDPERARIAQLPSYDEILANSDQGFATMLPMIVAWRIACREGILPRGSLDDLCRKQIALIKARLDRECGGRSSPDLLDTMALYERALSAP
jgi:Fe-S-cluster containining protein